MWVETTTQHETDKPNNPSAKRLLLPSAARKRHDA
jgi:hypothetical protein